MKPKTYSTEGIVLARKNYSEADRILIVYTKDFGKVSLIAKGVRRTRSRKRGALEVFSRVKFSASRGKGLDIMTEAEMISSFTPIRKDLKKVSVAYFVMETVGRLTREDEENRIYYSYIVESLGKLGKTKNTGNLRKQFVYDSLVLLGFWPKGKKMPDPDKILEEVTERQFSSSRVGKKILS